jgi:hypothetical protein
MNPAGRQIGNAVPPLLAKTIATTMLKAVNIASGTDNCEHRRTERQSGNVISDFADHPAGRAWRPLHSDRRSGDVQQELDGRCVAHGFTVSGIRGPSS